MIIQGWKAIGDSRNERGSFCTCGTDDVVLVVLRISDKRCKAFHDDATWSTVQY